MNINNETVYLDEDDLEYYSGMNLVPISVLKKKGLNVCCKIKKEGKVILKTL